MSSTYIGKEGLIYDFFSSPVFRLIWFSSASKGEQWGVVIVFFNYPNKLSTPLQSFFLLILSRPYLCFWVLLQVGFPVLWTQTDFAKIYQPHFVHFMLETWHQLFFWRTLVLWVNRLFWQISSFKSVLHSESSITVFFCHLFLQLKTYSVSHHRCNLPIYSSATSAQVLKHPHLGIPNTLDFSFLITSALLILPPFYAFGEVGAGHRKEQLFNTLATPSALWGFPSDFVCLRFSAFVLIKCWNWTSWTHLEISRKVFKLYGLT